MLKNYLVWMEIESFSQGWHNISKKLYFYWGPASRTSSKKKKKSKEMLFEPSFVMEEDNNNNNNSDNFDNNNNNIGSDKKSNNLIIIIIIIIIIATIINKIMNTIINKLQSRHWYWHDLGLVTKLAKRNTTTSKIFDGEVVLPTYDIIIFSMVDSEQSRTEIPDACLWFINRNLYLTKSENRTKKSLSQLSYYCFE